MTDPVICRLRDEANRAITRPGLRVGRPQAYVSASDLLGLCVRAEHATRVVRELRRVLGNARQICGNDVTRCMRHTERGERCPDCPMKWLVSLEATLEVADQPRAGR